MLFEGIKKIQEKYVIQIPQEYNDFILKNRDVWLL